MTVEGENVLRRCLNIIASDGALVIQLNQFLMSHPGQLISGYYGWVLKLYFDGFDLPCRPKTQNTFCIVFYHCKPGKIVVSEFPGFKIF